MRSGFTILEMALVVLIIGLLAAGILAGQALIRASDLNSVLTDVTKYTDAITQFRDKYEALPGDMPNAESYWGSAPACPNGDATGTEVCNGNGDGVIFNFNNAANMAELYSQWIELANAGFIKGSFHYTATTGWVLGSTTPTSDYNTGTFMFFYGAGAIFSSNLHATTMPYNIHWLSFGRLVSNAGVLRPVLTADDAYGMDKKMDDGKPGTGNIRGSRNTAVYGYTPSCQTSDVVDTADYNRANKDETCMLLFAIGQQ